MVFEYLKRGVRAVGYSVGIFGTCISLNLVQLITLPLWPFSDRLSYDLNSKLIAIMWTVLQHVFESTKQAKISFSGDRVPKSKSALIISNHVSWSDYYMINAVASRSDMLPYCRYFIKDSLKYLPFFGWGMWLMGMLFLNRNWSSDQKRIDKVFNRLTKNKHPVWLISYVEGTRFNKQKKVECQTFASTRNLPQLNHVLLPRTKGIVASIQRLRTSHIQYLYDFTIAYYHPTNGLIDPPNPIEIHLCDKLSPPRKFHIHLRCFNLDELPKDDKGLSDFVLELFKEKDRVLSLLDKGWVNALPIEFQVRDLP